MLAPLLTYALESLGALLALLTLYNTFRYIPNNRVGIVEKLWSAPVR